jgi:hypothetical protein
MKSLVTIFLFISGIAVAQSVKVTFIEIGDTLQKPKNVDFHYLQDEIDVTQLISVAKVSAMGSLEDPILLYNHIRMHAQIFGANAFKFDSFNKTATTGELTMSLYFASDEALVDNAAKVPRDNVYFFGHQNLLSAKTQSFKLDKNKYELKAGHFKKVPLQDGQSFRLAKGGTSILYTANAEVPRFVSFGGLGIAGADHVVQGAGQGLSINFSMGKIIPVDPNIAQVLLKIFTEQQ